MLRIALPLALCLPAPLAAASQEDPPGGGPEGGEVERGDVEHALEARARYLKLRPYHEQVFDDLLADLRAQGRLPLWIARYERSAAAGDRPDTVVLARLRAAQGRRAQALDLLEGLADGPPERDALVGGLHLDAGDPAAALPWLERAEAGLPPGDARDAVLRREAEAQLLVGAAGRAAAAFQRLVDGEPQDLGLRLEVADLCARGGLRQEAIAHYRTAERLAGDDPERRSRVLAELGGLHERELRPDEAAAAYDEALTLLGRGHWLEEDLLGRLVELHRRRGSLLDWRGSLEAARAERPSDPATAERLARALVATGQAPRALEVLAEAARRHEGDALLARQRLELARAHGTSAQRIEVLQAALGADERDVELRFELAEALAEDDHREGARGQWALLLERFEGDPEGLARVARRRAAWGEADEAQGLFVRARDLAPRDLARHADLARHLASLGRVDEASAGLVEAEALLDGPRALEELAALQRELGRPQRAERPLRRAGGLLPGEDRLVLSLADLLVDLDRPHEARPLLRDLLERTADLGLRDRALREYVDSFQSRPALGVAAEEEAQRAHAGTRRAPWLLAIAMREDLRDPAGARELLVEFLERHPDDRPARERLASILQRAGEAEEALAQLDQLVARFPRGARAWRLERAKLLAGQGRLAAAGEELEALVAAEPSQPQALEEASAAFAALGRPERAIELLERALRLGSTDAAGHLRMARLCLDDFRLAQANQHLRLAYREGSGRLRADALAALHELMVGQGRVRHEMQGLVRELSERPYDLPTAFLIVDLHVAQKEFRQALEVLGTQLERRPYEVRLFQRRAAVQRQIGLFEEAVRDLRAVQALTAEPPPELAYDLLEAHLAAGQLDEAARVAFTCEDPLRAARLLTDAGRGPDAVEVLRRARRARQGDPDLDRRLGEVHAALGESDQAIVALRRYVDGGGEDPAVLRMLGDLHFERGEVDAALELGARLLRTVAAPRSTRAWFEAKGLGEQWTLLRCRHALAHPRDGEGLMRLLEDLDRADDPVSAELVSTLHELARLARQEGVAPPGRSAVHWARLLLERERGLLERDASLSSARLRMARLAADGEGDLVDEGAALDLVRLGTLSQDRERLAQAERLLGADPLFSLELAALRAAAGEPQAAAASYGRAAQALAREELVAGEAQERERARRARAQALRSELTFGQRTSLEREDFEALVDLAEAAAALLDADAACPLDPAAATLRRAEQLALAGQREAALALIDAQVPGAGERAAPRDLARLAGACARAGLTARARALALRLDAALRELEARPELAQALEATALPTDLFANLGQHFRAVGAGVTAYDLLRDMGRLAQARAVAQTRDLKQELALEYRRRLEQEQAAFAPQDVRDEAWWAHARRLHDSAVKLAELHEWAEEPEGALAVWRRVEAYLPRERSVLTMKAVYAERSDRREEALAARRGVVSVLDGVDAPPPAAQRDAWLEPSVTGREPRARRSVTWVHLANFARAPEQDPRLDHLLASLRLELELGEMAPGLATLGRVVDLARDPPASWVRNLLHVLGGYAEIEGMAGHLASYHAQLHRLAPGNLQVITTYVKALWDADDLATARTVLAGYLASEPRISNQDRRDIETMVQSTEHLERVRHGDASGAGDEGE